MTTSEYLSALHDIFSRIEQTQLERIRSAGELVSESLAKGGIIHTFGSGHSHMIAEEAFFRAGGLAPVNVILDDRLIFLHGALESTAAERETGYAQRVLEKEKVEPGDVAIIISNSGRNAVPIEMAQGMHSLRAKVIAITNLRQSAASASRHASGKKLYEVADIAIDNCIPEGDAVLPVPQTSYKMGPSSTVAGAAIMNSIMIEAANCLLQKKLPVPVLPSANVQSASQEELIARLTQGTSRVRLLQTANVIR